MKTEINKFILLTAFSLFLSTVTQVSSRFAMSPFLPKHIPELYCKWEGQKIANPENDSKLFICQFDDDRGKWVSHPFSCTSHYRFDTQAQRCLPKGHGPNSRNSEEISEIPDINFLHPKNTIFENSGSYRNELRSNQKEPRDSCGESLRSLSSTIATLSKTIEKLSAKINSPPKVTPNNNATINVKLPDFLTLNEMLKGQLIFPPKGPEISQNLTSESKLSPAFRYDKNETNQVQKNISTATHEPFPFVTPMPSTPRTTTLRASIVPEVVTYRTWVLPEGLPEDSEEVGSQNSVVRPPPPGTSFMDFLFKNLLTPTQIRPPMTSPHHQGFKYQLNNSRPGASGVIYKPLPFRPRPPPPHFFNPVRVQPTAAPPIPNSGPTSSDIPPRPPAFVNMLSLLQKLNNANPFKLTESEEEEDSTSEEWNGISDFFIPTSKTVGAPGGLSRSTPVTSSISVSPTTTMSSSPVMTSSTGSSSSILTSSTESSLPSTRSSDFAEFDNNDDEAEDDIEEEDEEESLRLNNRKPRRV